MGGVLQVEKPQRKRKGKKMGSAVAHTESAATRRTRYAPPEKMVDATVPFLIGGTHRWNAKQPPQLSFLGSSGSSEKSDPDYLVHVAGDAALLRRPCVSVIGTRKATQAGAARARKVARGLVQNGVVIISGLAAGIDTEAMTAAMSGGGRVVGVIGTPLDKAYPASNAELQESVYREHLLVSQFGIGEKVWPSNFPRRNRLMAILSDATVVIEASDTSGTLHQAAECMKLGRWLFIAKSVVEDRSLTWPARFLEYETCVVLEEVKDITSRILI
ncbi:MAG TPA: DNA-processing protein DprA [Xanthobacteraceae bacterium]|nr:DNA-processing protein DprA [Xanthobacteraceae bacterium]